MKKVLALCVFAIISQGYSGDRSSISGECHAIKPSGSIDRWRLVDDLNYLSVIADFNGDAIKDSAMLLKCDSSKGLTLFIALAAMPRQSVGIKVIEFPDTMSLHSMGIESVQSGIYATLCGKGYRNCKEGESDSLRIKNESIRLFKVESASRLIYWDSDAKTFKLEWLSD